MMTRTYVGRRVITFFGLVLFVAIEEDFCPEKKDCYSDVSFGCVPSLCFGDVEKG